MLVPFTITCPIANVLFPLVNMVGAAGFAFGLHPGTKHRNAKRSIKYLIFMV